MPNKDSKRSERSERSSGKSSSKPSSSGGSRSSRGTPKDIEPGNLNRDAPVRPKPPKPYPPDPPPDPSPGQPPRKPCWPSYEQDQSTNDNYTNSTYEYNNQQLEYPQQTSVTYNQSKLYPPAPPLATDSRSYGTSYEQGSSTCDYGSDNEFPDEDLPPNFDN